MPSMNFAFGIGKYFTFTFNLQLGSAPSVKDEPAQQQTSIAHLPTSIEQVSPETRLYPNF